MARTVSIEGDTFVLDFPYAKRVVDAVRLIPGKRWDGDRRVWRVPTASAALVRRLVRAHEFDVADDATAEALTGADAADAYHVFADEHVRRLVIRTAYVKGLPEAIREIQGRRWNGDRKEWTIPAAQADTLADVVDKFRLLVHPNAQPILRSWSDEARELRRMSSAADADIEIPRLAAGEALAPYQRGGVAYARAAGWRTIIGDDPGLGKLQPRYAPILTPSGWRKIGDVAVGDDVIGGNGQTTRVVGVFPQGMAEAVEVRFTDGTVVECGWDHLWTVTTSQGARETVTTRQMHDGATIERERRTGAGLAATRTYRWSAAVRERDGRRRLRTPPLPPVEHPDADLPLDPYLLGVILGDGAVNANGSTSLTLNALDADDILDRCGISTVLGRPNGRGAVRVRVPAAIVGPVSALGLSGCRAWEKFVPATYLTAGPGQRLALLHGLMDTDGHANSAGGTEFSSTSESLAEAVVALAQSLGGVARKHGPRRMTYTYDGERRTGRESWRVNVKLSPGVNPFATPRKRDAYTMPTKYVAARVIDAIVATGRYEDSVCIRVANDDGLYVTTGYVVTHNTVETLAAAEVYDRWPIVIVVPTIVETNWRREIARFFPHRTSTNLRGQTARPLVGPHAERYDYYVIGYPVLHYWQRALLRLGPAGMICDEVQNLANPKNYRTIAAKAIAGVRDPEQDPIPGAVPDDGLILLASGTPASNATADLIEPLTIIGKLGAVGGLDHLRNRYVKIGDLDDEERRDRYRELNEVLRSTGCLLHRAKADVLTELPEKRRSFVWVDPDPHVAAEYRKAETNTLDYLADRARTIAAELGDDPESAAVMARMRASGAEALARIGTLRQIAARAKLPAAKQWAAQFLASGHQLGVYAWHRPIVEALADATGGRKLYGGMTPASRQAVIDDFQAGRCKVAVLSIKAAGVGITLTAASTALFLEYAWNPASLEQAEDRHHRRGQPNAVNVVYLLADGLDIDADMTEIVASKAVETSNVTRGTDGSNWDAVASDGSVVRGSVAAELLERMTRRALGRDTADGRADTATVSTEGAVPASLF